MVEAVAGRDRRSGTVAEKRPRVQIVLRETKEGWWVRMDPHLIGPFYRRGKRSKVHATLGDCLTFLAALYLEWTKQARTATRRQRRAFARKFVSKVVR